MPKVIVPQECWIQNNRVLSNYCKSRKKEKEKNICHFVTRSGKSKHTLIARVGEEKTDLIFLAE